MDRDPDAGSRRSGTRPSHRGEFGPSPVVVHWFRNDLRVDAHPALADVGRLASHLVCVSVRPAAERQTLPWGGPRVGPLRRAFREAALADLECALTARGTALFPLEREGDTPEAFADGLVSWAVAAGATLLTFVREVAPEERAEEAAVWEAAARRGLQVKAYAPSTLVDIDALPFPPEQAPDVFTAFRLRVEETQGAFPPPATVPTRLPSAPAGLAHLLRTARKAVGAEAQSSQGGARAAALQRLSHYLWESDAARTYFETRNALQGEDASTRFSPFLASGLLDAREVHEALTAYEAERGATKGTRWIVFELLWRDFFKIMALKHGVRLFCEAGLPGARKRAGRGPTPLGGAQVDERRDVIERNRGPLGGLLARSEEDRFAAWREGRTGLLLVDAAMRELRFTGGLSNRGRQIAASALVSLLGVRWTWGAWHFESQLVDYDPASNWGNWAYIAGKGNDPRGGRVFDVEKQTALHDPDGAYVRSWMGAS